MATEPGTLERIGRGIATVVTPLSDELASGTVLDFFARLGVQFPQALLTNHSQLVSALEAAKAAADGLPAVLQELTAAIDQGDDSTALAKGIELLGRVATLIGAIAVVQNELEGAAESTPGVDPNVIRTFAGDLPRRIVDYVIIRDGELYAPIITSILVLVGLVDRIVVPAKDATQPEYIQRALRFDRLGEFFQSPLKYAETLTGWGTNDLKPLFDRIASYLDLTLTQTTYTTAPLKIQAQAFTLETTSTTPPGVKFTINVPLDSGLDLRLPVSPGNFLHLLTEADFKGGLTGTVAPPAQFSATASAELKGRMLLGYSREPVAPATESVLFGDAKGSRIAVKGARVDAGVNFLWSSGTNTATIEPLFRGGITGGKIVIDTSNADGFIGKVMGGLKVEGNFDTRLTWTPSSGFHFEGSATIEIAIPMHVSLGPIEISQLYLVGGFTSDGIPIQLSVAIGAKLGPLQASVDRIGAEARITFPPGGGNAGPANVALGFKPPNGVGLSIDVSVVKGGGFLFIDVDRGEYAGAIELTIMNFLSIKAIGLITTKMPDGSPGFSLLIIITAEFGSGIQLGFGFVLIGVGGLLGLNRTMKLQPLSEGVRDGSIDNILFPKDIIANAPRIISDLKKFFPPEQGHFLIGPMAKLGWGTPALVTVSIGIVIEIPPGNIAILGVLRVVLPTQEAAVLKLQVAFIGAIEPDKKRLWFFASLFDSRILFLTIEGEFGLLIAWGDDANFVLSVGGFHPSFSPPPLPFPSPKRLAVSLIDTDYARVRIEGYFAVTSNTVQFGAAVDIFFGLEIISIRGNLTFDALFQFSPFYFIISLSATFSLNAFGFDLLTIRIKGSLEGPTPWRVKGTGYLKILFFEISADFEVEWGEKEATTLPPLPILPIIRAELEKVSNWRALPPAGNNILVSLRPLPESETLVLHPVGTLRIAQRALPLDLTLEKVGTQKPSDVNRLSLSAGGGLVKKADALEQFAPAEFRNYSDAEKLSRPAFAPEHAGLELTSSGADVRTAKMVKRIVRYETIILDSNRKREEESFTGFPGGLFAHFAQGGAVAKSELSQARKKKLEPFDEKIGVSAERYTVAYQADNKPFAPDDFHSEASAREFLEEQTARDKNLAGKLHVIPSFERAA